MATQFRFRESPTLYIRNAVLLFKISQLFLELSIHQLKIIVDVLKLDGNAGSISRRLFVLRVRIEVMYYVWSGRFSIVVLHDGRVGGVTSRSRILTEVVPVPVIEGQTALSDDAGVSIHSLDYSTPLIVFSAFVGGAGVRAAGASFGRLDLRSNEGRAVGLQGGGRRCACNCEVKSMTRK
jgi:hypothetical protein